MDKASIKRNNASKKRICFQFRVNFYKSAGVNFTFRRQYSVCHSETPETLALQNFTKSGARFWKLKPSRKCTQVSSCARIRSYDCLKNAGVNAREWSISNVIHILATILATSYACSADRSYSALHRLKTNLFLIMGQQAHMIDSLERIFSLVRRPLSMHRMTLVPSFIYLFIYLFI